MKKLKDHFNSECKTCSSAETSSYCIYCSEFNMYHPNDAALLKLISNHKLRAKMLHKENIKLRIFVNSMTDNSNFTFTEKDALMVINLAKLCIAEAVE